MKALLLIAIVLVLVALDWAAVHDILKGEPNLHGEYAMVVFSVVTFAVLIYIGLRGRHKGANVD
jgi:hypothetical protein